MTNAEKILMQIPDDGVTHAYQLYLATGITRGTVRTAVHGLCANGLIEILPEEEIRVGRGGHRKPVRLTAAGRKEKERLNNDNS